MKSQIQAKQYLSTKYLLCTLIHLQRRSDQQGGYTLVVTVAMLLILSVLLVTYAVSSKIDNVTSMSSAKSNTGFYTAEAGLNNRAKQIRNAFENFDPPTGLAPAGLSACLDSISTNNGSNDFQCQEDAFQESNTEDSFKNQISDQKAITFVTPNSNNPLQVVIPSGETFGGLSAKEYRYSLFSVAQDNQNKPTAILKMQIKTRLIPLFQFAAFYQQDMDFIIPLDMTLNGPVHSNNDLYLDAADGHKLDITGQVTMAGKLYRGSKYENFCHGTVNVKNPATFKALPCDTVRNQFSAAALRSWNGQIQTGLRPLKTPEPASFKAEETVSDQSYWGKADLRIALNLPTRTIEVQNLDGSSNDSATAALSAACVASPALITVDAKKDDLKVTVDNPSAFTIGQFVTLGSYTTAYVVESISGSDITLNQGLLIDIPANTSLQMPVVSFSDRTFNNYREKRSGVGREAHTAIHMLNVNVRKILNCSESLMDGGKLVDDDTNGGLVWFLTVKGADSETINDYGVRLYNGQDLTSPVNGRTIKGLSIVSDQAVYVQGNYNCRSICNSGNLDEAGDEHQPAAIMADSLNVLSNAWPLDDSWSERELRSTYAGVRGPGRPAENTTINAAFLSGIDITGGVNGTAGQNKGSGTSGGGLNNFPRFHEDWSDRETGPDVTFFYQGSMVSLGPSLKVNGAFCGSGSIADCNIYNPPNRQWFYDKRFNDAANLPPMTPQAVYLKQENFVRDFGALSQGQPLLRWVGQLPTLLGSLTHLWQRTL